MIKISYMNMGGKLEFIGTRFYDDRGNYLEYVGLGERKSTFSNRIGEVLLFKTNNIGFFRDVFGWCLPSQDGKYVVFNEYGGVKQTIDEMYHKIRRYNKYKQNSS